MLHVHGCQPEVNHPATHISDNTSLKPVYHIYLIKSSAPNKLQFAPPPNQKIKNEVHKRNIDYSIPNFTFYATSSCFNLCRDHHQTPTSYLAQFKLHTVINKTLTNKNVNPIHSYTLAHKNMQDQRT